MEDFVPTLLRTLSVLISADRATAATSITMMVRTGSCHSVRRLVYSPFPDSFVFQGSKNSINQQIGNAVPPLLAYQIASCFPKKGQFVDLFSGAGGLALGFIWAGWEPIVANDVERSYLKTYQANIDESVVLGDIRDANVL